MHNQGKTMPLALMQEDFLVFYVFFGEETAVYRYQNLTKNSMLGIYLNWLPGFVVTLSTHPNRCPNFPHIASLNLHLKTSAATGV